MSHAHLMCQACLDAKAEIMRLRAALKLAAVALDGAECVIDVDDCVDVFQAVQSARKVTKQTLEQSARGND